MTAPRPTRSSFPVLAGVLLVCVPACTTQRPIGPQALEAPVVSPPAHATVEERIVYWEDRLPVLSPPDQAEARLCLGELQLEAGETSQARINFLAARNGYLSAQEEAQTAWGIGRAYLLDKQPSRAVRHLREASAHLGGPEGEECDFLLAYAEGKSPSASSSGLMARVARYTAGDVVTATPSSPSLDARDLIDVTRASWGAKSMQSNFDRMDAPYRLTVHHTAEPADTHSHDAAAREMRDLQRMHQEGNGWADLGYHFLIDQAGRIHEGRPISAQGAHAGNSDLNRGNIGICLLGNFVAQPERGADYSLAQAPTDEQWEALDRLVDQLQLRYRIADNQIWAHSHLKETACPGPALLSWVQSRRRAR